MNTHQWLAGKRDESRSGVLAVALAMSLVIVVFLSLTFSVRAQSPFSPIFNLSVAQQAAQENQPSQLTIRFNNEGLTPANATALAGRVLLKVENQIPQKRLTLRINRQGGELLREVALPDNATEWNTELELSVGQYVVTETSRTGGSCVITVQAPPAGQ